MGSRPTGFGASGALLKKINKTRVSNYPLLPYFFSYQITLDFSSIFAIFNIMITIHYGISFCIISISVVLHLFSIMSVNIAIFNNINLFVSFQIKSKHNDGETALLHL